MRYAWTSLCWIAFCFALLGFLLPLVMSSLLWAQTGEKFDVSIIKEVWLIGMFHAGALISFIFGTLYLLANAKRSNRFRLRSHNWAAIIIGIAAIIAFYAINANIDNYSALSLLILLGAAIFIYISFKTVFVIGSTKND